MNDDEIKAFVGVKGNLSPLLPDYVTLDDILAPGGQGLVYRGRVNTAEAAVKVYFPGQVEVRVNREIAALSKLNNSHIVKLLWSGSVEIDHVCLPAVATELINGTPLNAIIQGRALQHSEIGTIVRDIAVAIDAMWQHLIVHRDLKPANILIRPNGRACVIDLGVARHIDRTPLTATGFTWGTMGYMSPEQTRAARQLTCKSDIFALGVIAVECALGRHPTRQDQLRLLSLELHNNLPREISSWKYAPLIAEMLHPRPTRRPNPKDIYQTLAEFDTGG